MSQRQGLLAVCFQEPITAIVRLRAGRQAVSDADHFREQMRHALKTAAREARDAGGYSSADVRSATFAVVAFLDESVLNSRNPAFTDWARKPLQEELFGTHVAGEVFFDNLGELLARPDSEALADVLEVYCLSLLLGFAGRHTGGRRGELAGIVIAVRDRITRIRGAFGDLSPAWAPSPSAVSIKTDASVRKLSVAAVLLAAIALFLFIAYRMQLASGVTEARELAAEVQH